MAVENSSKLSIPSLSRSIASKVLRAMPLSWKPALTNDLANSSSCRTPSPLTSYMRKYWLHIARNASLNSWSFFCCKTDSTMMDGVIIPLSSDSADFIHIRHICSEITTYTDIHYTYMCTDIRMQPTNVRL